MFVAEIHLLGSGCRLMELACQQQAAPARSVTPLFLCYFDWEAAGS